MNVPFAMISKYAGYFHDGTVHEIQHENDAVIFSIESAELLSEWDWDRNNIPLSKRKTITGKLHLYGIKWIKENDKIFLGALKMVYADADLYDIELEDKRIKLLITWEQFLPKKVRTDMFCIEIEAEKIYWENIPTLFDAYWDSL